MSIFNVNTVVIPPFERGDRVDASRHHVLRDCKTTEGTVIGCKKDAFGEYLGPAMWMVEIKLDNGRVVGVRPKYLNLITAN